MQLGSGGTTGSIGNTSGLVDNGMLAFNRADNVVFNLPVTGSGGLQQMGPGVLTLGALNTYSGPTIISGGTLRDALLAAPTVVHLAMNGTGSISNGGTIADSSSNHFNATMNGSGASYVSSTAPFGGGINTNGRSIVVPANPAFDNLQSWTDSVWVNISSSSASGCLVACRDYDSMHGLWRSITTASWTPPWPPPAAAGCSSRRTSRSARRR